MKLKEVELETSNFELLFIENMKLDKLLRKIDFTLTFYVQARQMQIDLQSHERWSTPIMDYIVYGVGASEV